MTDLRHAMHMCERCHRRTELSYVDDLAEYLCDECLDNHRTSAAETAWEHFVEAFHDGGSTRFKTLADQQAEVKKFK